MKLLNSLSACSPVENAGQFSRSGNVVMTLIRNANMFNVKERKRKILFMVNLWFQASASPTTPEQPDEWILPTLLHSYTSEVRLYLTWNSLHTSPSVRFREKEVDFDVHSFFLSVVYRLDSEQLLISFWGMIIRWWNIEIVEIRLVFNYKFEKAQ